MREEAFSDEVRPRFSPLVAAGVAKPPAREAIRLRDAAIVLDVCERTLRRWGKSGRIRLVRIGPKLLRVPKDEIARLRREL